MYIKIYFINVIQGVDFRCNDEMRHNCNEQKDPAYHDDILNFLAICKLIL